MAVDLSEFEAFVAVGGQCQTGKALRSLKPSDSEKLAAALAEPSLTNVQIVKWLQTREIKIGTSSLGRHRRGECGCAT